MQESPGQTPDRLDDSKSFLSQNLYSLLNKSLSKILLQMRSKEADRRFLMYCLSF